MDQFSRSPNLPAQPQQQPPRDFSGLKPPESMTVGNASGGAPLVFPGQNQPSAQPPSPAAGPKPRSPLAVFIIICFLVILLVAAILIFVSWKGWISLGGIEKLWGGGGTTITTPSPEVSITLAPATPTPESFDAQRKRDLATLQSALKKYFADNSQYPVAQTEIKTSDTNSVLYLSLVPNYIVGLPDDPLAPQYFYGYKSDGKTFQLTAVLEDLTDSSGTLHGNLNIYTVTDLTGE